jgi:hypothetical protein
LPVLIFWLGRFHFSKEYLIGRNISFEKTSKIDCDFWKEAGGYSITGRDCLKFDGDCKIKDDTLYFGEKPIAKVISLVQRCFIDYELTIQSFDKQKTDFYVSK